MGVDAGTQRPVRSSIAARSRTPKPGMPTVTCVPPRQSVLGVAVMGAPFGVGGGDDVGERGIPARVEHVGQLVEDAGGRPRVVEGGRADLDGVEAPAAASSRASRPGRTPPTPMIGAGGGARLASPP
jgi:hypothetical protein